METCEQCKWWKRYGTNGKGGHCHRYPRKLFIFYVWDSVCSNGNYESWYPNVDGDDFCGEFKEKEKKKDYTYEEIGTETKEMFESNGYEFSEVTVRNPKTGEARTLCIPIKKEQK